MKLPLRLICLFSMLGAATVIAQAPAAPSAAPMQHSLMLDVQNKGAGGAEKVVGNGQFPTAVGGAYGAAGTATSTQTQTRNHSTTLEITIRSLGKVDDNVQVEWYFFSKPVNGRGAETAFDTGSKAVTVKPNGDVVFDVSSKVLQSAIVNTRSSTVVGSGSNQTTSFSSSQSQKGDKLTGWVVRILADGKVINVRGSDFKYEDMAKDPGPLKPAK